MPQGRKAASKNESFPPRFFWSLLTLWFRMYRAMDDTVENAVAMNVNTQVKLLNGYDMLKSLEACFGLRPRKKLWMLAK